MMSLRSHNLLDYAVAAALVLSPYVFGFSELYYARNIFLSLGIALAGYSLLTDYPFSIAKVVPISLHMVFEVVSGLFLMLAPSIYGYGPDLSGFQYAIHFVYGIGLIAMVVTTGKATGLRPLAGTEEKNEEDIGRAA